MNNQIQWDKDELEMTRKLADAKAKALQTREQLMMSLRRYYAVMVKNTEN